MKPRYALLELVGAAIEPDSGATARVNALNKLESRLISRYKVSANQSFPDLSPFVFAVLYGSTTGADLMALCKKLKEAEVWPIVAMDAISSSECLESTFSTLEVELVQLAKAAGAAACIMSECNFVYPFEKASCTATVCLLFDGGTQALVIERLHDPEKGKRAFPGGFMRTFVEDMEDCAYRELEEECGVRLAPGELELIDVRSSPERDKRSHIVDAGYAALLNNQRKDELVKQMKAGDDAGKVFLMSVADLIAGELAFDHHDFLLSTLRHFNLLS